MNYNNYSMDELANHIPTILEATDFIEASKVFVERWLGEDHTTQDQMDNAVEEACDDQAIETRNQCRDEMVQAIENEMAATMTEDDWASLISTAQTLG